MTDFGWLVYGVGCGCCFVAYPRFSHTDHYLKAQRKRWETLWYKSYYPLLTSTRKLTCAEIKDLVRDSSVTGSVGVFCHIPGVLIPMPQWLFSEPWQGLCSTVSLTQFPRISLVGQGSCCSTTGGQCFWSGPAPWLAATQWVIAQAPRLGSPVASLVQIILDRPLTRVPGRMREREDERGQ
jgi:hypothetical protein